MKGHIHIPSPFAPSFIAINKDTGELVWESDLPGENILHGQWSNPAYAEVDGVPQVILPGGDGWVYSLEPETGKLIWKFDCNPKDSVWQLGGRGTRNAIICDSRNLQQQGLCRSWTRPGTWTGRRTPLGDRCHGQWRCHHNRRRLAFWGRKLQSYNIHRRDSRRIIVRGGLERFCLLP